MVAETKPSDRVGVVGLGGLGHLAVVYARAMGCDVVVFSSDESKRADAAALGAAEFHVMPSSASGGVTVTPGVNVMLLCGGGLPDFDVYIHTFLIGLL